MLLSQVGAISCKQLFVEDIPRLWHLQYLEGYNRIQISLWLYHTMASLRFYAGNQLPQDWPQKLSQWKMKMPQPFNSYILYLWLLWQTKWFMLLSSTACFEWYLSPSLNYIYINWHLLLGQNIPFPFFTKCRIRLVWVLSLIPPFHLFHLEWGPSLALTSFWARLSP